jgi:hypothetical protein
MRTLSVRVLLVAVSQSGSICLKMAVFRTRFPFSTNCPATEVQ